MPEIISELHQYIVHLLYLQVACLHLVCTHTSIHLKILPTSNLQKRSIHSPLLLTMLRFACDDEESTSGRPLLMSLTTAMYPYRGITRTVCVFQDSDNQKISLDCHCNVPKPHQRPYMVDVLGKLYKQYSHTEAKLNIQPTGPPHTTKCPFFIPLIYRCI